MNIYSYVVEHDNGHAPNPYFSVCTLCRCKFGKHAGKPRNVVELAVVGDWIIGTGGANLRKSTGHGTLVYAMRVDEKLTSERYFSDPRFTRKKPAGRTYAQMQGDNVEPNGRFEQTGQYALVSEHFYYFGANAIAIPKQFAMLEKTGPGFKKRFNPTDIKSVIDWLTKNYGTGKHGEPCGSAPDSPSDSGNPRGGRCKSSC